MAEGEIRGFIEQIEVHNFKSYKGAHTIGPFKPFTAVVGPNGSGKSNVMDAVSFVLGLDAKKLRGTSLGDLVYDDGQNGPKPEECFVRMTFVDATGEDHIFTRFVRKHLQKDGAISWKSEYSYRGKKDQKSYEAGLSNLGVSIAIPNCLVFQGEVESIARKSPKELTALFEYISGSDQFKSEYEQVLRERDVAKEDANFLEKKRKGLKVEQREYKDQKKEADVHAHWASELVGLKRRSILCQLFWVAEEIQKAEEEIEAKRVEDGNVQARLDEVVAKLPGLRKEQASATKAFEAFERDLRSDEKVLEHNRPELLVKENELLHVQSKLNGLERDAEEAQRRYQIAVDKRKQLEKELADLDASEASFRKENDSAMQLSGKQLTDAEMKEFAQIKEKARTTSSAQRSELATLEREQESDVSLFEELHKPRMKDLEEKLKLMEQEELPSAKRKLAALEDMIRRLKGERDAFEKERVSIQAENEAVVTEKAKLDQELESLQEELKKVRVDMNETERQQRMDDCLQSMKRLFPGVHGRIIDLVEPSQDRYRPALTVALGAQMESIVVADKDVATDCMKYMKEQRIGVATFIPLDSIRVTVSYDPLRLLEPGVIKPIIDVLKYDPIFQSAIEFVCGSTLVCADLDKARQWAFNTTGRRYKVVTFDGMLIAKSGFMTGGVIGRDSRVQRWDAKKVNELKTQRDTKIVRLNELNNAMRNVARERELQGLLATLDAKLSAHQIDYKAAQESCDSLTKRIADAQQKLETNRVSFNALQSKIDELAPKITTLRAQISATEDTFFADFSKRVGIENLREWEDTRKVRLKSLAEKGLIFKTQRARIQNLLDYAVQQEARYEFNETESSTSLDSLRLRVNAIKGEIRALKEDIQSKTEAIASRKLRYEELREEMEKKGQALKKAQSDVNARTTLHNALLKWIDSRKALLEQLKTKRHQVLESARNDDVELPRLDGKKKHKGAKKSGKKPSKPVRGQSDMDVDEEENGEEEASEAEGDLPSLKATQSMSIQEIEARTEEEDAIKVDFSELEEEYKRCKTQAQRDDKLATIVADIQSVSAKLDSVMPNYKANDRLDLVGTSIEKLDEEIEAAHKRAEDCRHRYLQIREQRKRTFMDAFNKINDHINEVYKALTGGFGQAHLENAVEDPYAHPITYSCAPKSKAFTDIQHLSGGEQSVAALALLFAIQFVRPSPFFVLDEIDAALDTDNVGGVAEYFKACSDSLQFIVISLKDKCFEKADALVGIYQDRFNKTSRCLTLDLNAMCGGPYERIR
jgi:structural maintenance of chromosome 1